MSNDSFLGGYKVGINEANKKLEKEYQRGANDAWELVKKLYEYKCGDSHAIFGTYWISDILADNTPFEAMAKVEKYENEKVMTTDKILDYMRENNICIFHIYGGGIGSNIVRCTLVQFHNHVLKSLPQDKFYTRIINAGKIKGVHMYRVTFYRYDNDLVRI